MSARKAERQCAAWKHPIGTPVVVRKDDGSELATKTCSMPEVMGNRAVIWLEAIRGCYLLDRVRVEVSA